MPNHITNIIAAEPAMLATIAALLKGDGKQVVDFERLIPMPDDIERGNISFYAMEKTNGRNWYDWSIKHWGTKWNAYDIDMSPGAIRFDTAWRVPEPILRSLAVAIPGPWTWDYADEDIGSNCGTWTCDEQGKLTLVTPIEGEDARRFAYAVKRYSAEDIKEIEGEMRADQPLRDLPDIRSTILAALGAYRVADHRDEVEEAKAWVEEQQ